MQLTCPKCAATYDVPDNAIGPNGRKIRCRACDANWHEPPRTAMTPPPPLAPQPGNAATAAPIGPPMDAVSAEAGDALPVRRTRRGPWLLLALAVLVVALGVAAAVVAFGSRQVASRLGLAHDRVPLGIEITHQPDWRQIPGGSQLFAVSGRIWNPTSVEQPVPDIRAELKDKRGRRVYGWTIARPVARLGPGQQISFDGAAVDVPAASSNVSVSFAGTEGN